jgi:hypothetical protein
VIDHNSSPSAIDCTRGYAHPHTACNTPAALALPLSVLSAPAGARGNLGGRGARIVRPAASAAHPATLAELSARKIAACGSKHWRGMSGGHGALHFGGGVAGGRVRLLRRWGSEAMRGRDRVEMLDRGVCLRETP